MILSISFSAQMVLQFLRTPIAVDTVIVGVLDALKIEKHSDVGNSFGGALGLMTALAHSSHVDKLVVLGTPCGSFR